MKKARVFLSLLILVSFLLPLGAPAIAYESSATQEAQVMESVGGLLKQIVSYINSSHFLALVAAGVPQKIPAISDAQTVPATPSTPSTPTKPPKDKELHDWCVRKGGVYKEIPGYDPVCIIKTKPSDKDEKFRFEVCLDTGIPLVPYLCIKVKIICPAANPPGTPAPACYVIVDIPASQIKCTLIEPSQYPGKVQLRCTGIEKDKTTDLCYQYIDPPKYIILKQCVTLPDVPPVFKPITIIPIDPFIPWVTPPSTLPPQFLPPGFTIPTPESETPTTPNSASLQSLIGQLTTLVNQINLIGKTAR